MKRFLSLLLSAAILFAVPVSFVQTAEAANQYKMVLHLDSADDVTNFNHRWGTDGNALTASSANATDTKLSAYSVPWVNHYDQGNCQFKWARNANFDMTGYNFINIWAYSNEAFSSYISFSIPTASNSSFAPQTVIDFEPGWNLITIQTYSSSKPNTSFATLQTYGATGVTGMSLNSDGKFHGATEKQAYSSTRAVYFDSIFLTVDAPGNNDFEAITVKEGADKVLTTTQTLKFKAPGLVESSLNANNVTVKYCREGTHDELNHSQATLSAGTDYTLGYEKDTLKVNFTNELVAGTTYNVHIGGTGFEGDLALPFGVYDLSFRTLGEGENIPPQVTLSGVTAGQRFFPSEGAITLTATASDINGTVEKVEFYADETLLGEVTESVEELYTFIWENPEEDANGYDITAKAYDNQGDATQTEPVSILVLDLKNPEVSLTAPTEDVVLSRNFDGIASAISLAVSADVTCIGSTPAEVEFVLDGDTVHTANNIASTYSYTLTDLSLGEHNLYVRVTDEYDMQGISNSVKVTVQDFAKVLPGVMEEDFETFTEGEAIAWSQEGEALSFTAVNYADNTVAKLLSENAEDNETVFVQKRYRNTLTSTPWEASIRVNFADLNLDRKIEVSGATEGLVLDFKTDGGVYVGTTKIADYKAGEWYDVKLVVNQAARTFTGLFDDVVAVSKTAISTTYSQNGASIKVSQNAQIDKSGAVLLDDAGVYKIAETNVEATGIAVYAGQVEANLASVPVTADKLIVSLNEAMGESLTNNVWVFDTVEERKISLEYDAEAVYFNEELRGSREYKVIVTTGVSGVSGQAIAKNVEFSFTTAPKDGEITGATFSEAELSGSVTSVTCEMPFVNNSGAEHNMKIVACLYNGDAMQDIIVQSATVSAGTPSDTLSITIPIVSYTENLTIEVFVVDDMNNMTPVSENIYTLN